MPISDNHLKKSKKITLLLDVRVSNNFVLERKKLKSLPIVLLKAPLGKDSLKVLLSMIMGLTIPDKTFVSFSISTM